MLTFELGIARSTGCKDGIDTLASYHHETEREKMLPPALEIFVVWHPKDSHGAEIANEIFAHFTHGTAFSDVFGGGIHVSFRCERWESSKSQPRPIYCPQIPDPNGTSPARFIAVVPLLGMEMAANMQKPDDSWRQYISNIRDLNIADSKRFKIFLILISENVLNGTYLGDILKDYQYIETKTSVKPCDDDPGMMCRNLTQGIAQMMWPEETRQLTAFISYKTRHGEHICDDDDDLASLVRDTIRKTRLNDFIDTNNLQPGMNWPDELKEKAETSPMLAIRTDEYSRSEWCQREIAAAKLEGMPVIMIDAIDHYERRGSFIMDHVPRVAVRKSNGRWQKRDVYHALNSLVDECLKRALWLHQMEIAKELLQLDVAWWAPHAPEPFTLSKWINSQLAREKNISKEEPLRILHPDPPLGPMEMEILGNYTRMTRLERNIDIMTPQQLSMRWIGANQSDSILLSEKSLCEKGLGISASESQDLSHLGLTEEHFRVALGEITRVVVNSGGDLFYGGHLQPDGITAFLIKELQRYGRRDRPLKVCLAWNIHRKMSEREIAVQNTYLGLFGEIHFLSSDGRRLCEKEISDAPRDKLTPEEVAASLTALRGYICEQADARIVIGGKRSGFQGAIPGIVEEALLSLQRRKPLFLVGGFGGATLDIIRALRPSYADRFTPRTDDEVDPRLAEGLKKISETADENSWDGFENGLSYEENLLLATTYRSNEIAALVGKGLARIYE